MDVDRNVVLANFQACTTIEDIGICMAILDQHDWDLQNAVHAALQSQENENSNPVPPSTVTQRTRSPPRPTRQITFTIHAQGSERNVAIDECSHVGTLLQIVAVECNLRQDDLMQFSGWPGGDQPDNDIPLRYDPYLHLCCVNLRVFLVY